MCSTSLFVDYCEEEKEKKSNTGNVNLSSNDVKTGSDSGRWRTHFKEKGIKKNGCLLLF